MDAPARLAALLHELRELGVSELFLDDLSAREAESLVGTGAGTSSAAPGPTGGGRGPGRAAARRGERPAGGGPGRSGRELLAEVMVESFAGPPPDPDPDPDADGAGGGVAVAGGGTGGAGEAEASSSPGRHSLPLLQAEASGCTKCRLAEGRTQVVFGRGSGAAELVVVGEAPGAEEDRTGLPFVGPAGKLLDLLLLSVGFDRERVYICNVLKCRPPGNRNPLADEVETCAPYLHGQLEAIAPKVLLAVGKFSAQMLTGREESIGSLRGQVHTYRGIPVVATYHPAYLLRSPQATRKTWHDLQLMRQVLDEHARG